VLLILRIANLDQALTALKGARPAWLGLALVSVAVNTLAKAMRWHTLMGPARRQVSFKTILLSLLAGQMLNTALFTRLGDLHRAYVVGGMGPGRTFVLGTVVLEKLVDLFSYGLLFLLLFVVLPLPGWMDAPGYGFAAVMVLLSAAVYLFVFERKLVKRSLNASLARIPERWSRPVASRLDAGLSSLEVLTQARSVLPLALLTGLVWATALLNNQLVLLSLGLHLPPAASLLVLVGLIAGISLPSAPGTLGVFEYICVLALGAFQVDPAIALAFGLVLHVVVLVPTTVLGVISFWLLGGRGAL
jgi:uncharacterized protein (TIRG00374 family)